MFDRVLNTLLLNNSSTGRVKLAVVRMSVI